MLLFFFPLSGFGGGEKRKRVSFIIITLDYVRTIFGLSFTGGVANGVAILQGWTWGGHGVDKGWPWGGQIFGRVAGVGGGVA